MADAPIYPGLDALDPTTTTLIAVGDTQETALLELVMEQNRHRRPHLLAAIAARRPGAVLHLGDLVTWGASRRHWARLDRELAALREARVPLLPVFGNHDRWPFARPAEARMKARFPLLAAQPWYTFRVRGVAFVALDSNFAALGRAVAEAQELWLDALVAELAADPDVRAIVGYWHHPPWTNSRLVRPSTRARERLLGALARTPKSLAVLTGHCHAYEHFVDAGLTLLVSGGGGGPRHPLETRPHKRRREDLFAGGARRFMHFLELTLGPDALTIDVVKQLDDLTVATVATSTLPYAPPARAAAAPAS